MLDGWAADALLDTYGAERSAVATRNARQSLTNFAGLAALSVLAEGPPESDPERLLPIVLPTFRTEAAQ